VEGELGLAVFEIAVEGLLDPAQAVVEALAKQAAARGPFLTFRQVVVACVGRIGPWIGASSAPDWR
jgi:hypothetical protein